MSDSIPVADGGGKSSGSPVVARSGITDDKSSTWVRTLQMGMGGSLLIPRVGWEVPVMYMDGSPDRPVVLGRAYNGQRVVPYSLPGAKAVSTLQSATTPFDGTVNEIRMTDSAGKQEMRIQASRDQSVLVGLTFGGESRGRWRVEQPRSAECCRACRRHDRRSKIPAAPIPPPTHIVTSP